MKEIGIFVAALIGIYAIWGAIIIFLYWKSSR